MFPLETESAGSSPTKSPNTSTMPAQPTERRRRQPAAQGTPVQTPGRATTLAEETQYASAWNIPALRTPGIEASPSRHMQQGPAAKMSRRQAWLKFLAYEGAVQVCLDALLHGGEDASPAAGFLAEGCASLKSALNLYNITLPPADDTQIAPKDAVILYWDDKEESNGLHPMLLGPPDIDTLEVAGDDSTCNGSIQEIEDDPDSGSVVDEESLEVNVTNDRKKEGGESGYMEFTGGTGGPLDPTLPIVEASLIRVVGCPLMDLPGRQTRPDAFESEIDPKNRFSLVMHPVGSSDCKTNDPILMTSSYTWLTTIGTPADGQTLRQRAQKGAAGLLVPPHAPSTMAIMVKLHRGDTLVGAGTVQVSELQRCAVHRDASMDDDGAPPSSTGGGIQSFFKRQFGRSHNDPTSRASPYYPSSSALPTGGSSGSGGSGGSGSSGSREGGSMCWVRLIDAQGDDAGHAILAAKVVPASQFLRPNANNALAQALTTATTPTPTANPGNKKKVTLQLETPGGARQGVSPSAPAIPQSRHHPRRTSLRPPSQRPSKTHLNNSDIVTKTWDQHPHGKLQTTSSGGLLEANAQNVYDVLLEAAFAIASHSRGGVHGHAQSQMQAHLPVVVRGPWAWLLQRYAMRYGVRQQYATLAHLRLVVGGNATQRHDPGASECIPSHAPPRSASLSILAAELGPLLDGRERMTLTSSELAILNHVLHRVDRMLTDCYENYFALPLEDDDHQNGDITGLLPGSRREEGQGTPEDGLLAARPTGVPASLRPALALLQMTKGQEAAGHGASSAVSVHDWLIARLRTAAKRRFYAILAAVEVGRSVGRQVSFSPSPSQPSEKAAAAAAYARVEKICTTVMKELRADEMLHRAGVFENTDIVLPLVTAREYVRGTVAYLQRTLQRHPPPEPSAPAVRLVEYVGRLQSFLERHGWLSHPEFPPAGQDLHTDTPQGLSQGPPAPLRLEAREIFGGFISEWISGTAGSLRRALRAMDPKSASHADLCTWSDLTGRGRRGGGGGGRGRRPVVLELVEAMLTEVESAAARFERIVAHWPSYAQDLEAALAAVLRDTTAVASTRCGLLSTPSSTPSTSPLQGFKPKEKVGVSEQKQKIGMAWRWASPAGTNDGGDGGRAGLGLPKALRRGGARPHQILLLNTLRRLLAVIPQLESSLRDWCLGGHQSMGPAPVGGDQGRPANVNVNANVNASARDGAVPYWQLQQRLDRDAPDLGAHWAQLVKEIRTEYYACCTLTVEALARELSSSSETSISVALNSNNAEQSTLSMALEATAPVIHVLAGGLDARVAVAVVRGLWDFAARDVLRFVENLNDGESSHERNNARQNQAWRVRKSADMCLKTIDAFYKGELSVAMGADLRERDLHPPQHAQRAAALLAGNTMDGNLGFEVY